MSAWENIACCDDCWWKRQPGLEGRMPTRIVQEIRELEACHFCGWTTYSGIYVRVNTDDTPAAPLRARKEQHDEHSGQDPPVPEA